MIPQANGLHGRSHRIGAMLFSLFLFVLVSGRTQPAVNVQSFKVKNAQA